MRAPHPSHDESEARALADVSEFGVHIVHILADEDGPAFSYTVGLHEKHEQPEVLVFGLPHEVAHELLNDLADLVAGGRRFAPGDRSEDLIEGYPVQFLAVTRPEMPHLLAMADWVYEGSPFAALQMVYPDKMGRWPWDEGCQQGFRDGQPLFGDREPGDSGSSA
ncbi:MAG: DUF4262 domain-containing protein [bacterium]|nr:DUF4262 domain-containing protein [bacterium]